MQFKLSVYGLTTLVVTLMILPPGAIGAAEEQNGNLDATSNLKATGNLKATSSYPYVIFGPNGAIARIAIPTSAPIACPKIKFNTSPLQLMQVHAKPSRNFPVQVCQLGMPKNLTSASINNQPLPIPKAAPQKLLVIGDTGCRIEGSLQQACNDPQKWPFAQLAQSAAQGKPDLVIHVGDYYYRETQCTTPGCNGSPFGDNWKTWEADLFKPARPLMATAPWVVIRGNHEICQRGGEGWFHLLDPRPIPVQCPDYTDPYAVPAGKLSLVVLDSSLAADSTPPPDQVQQYRKQFQLIAKLTTTNTWLVTHKPVWAFSTATKTLNPTLQQAIKGIPLTGMQQILSGHIHLFESLSFPTANNRPAQLVIGNSGTSLNSSFPSPQGKTIDGVRVDRGFVRSQFGSITLQPTNSTLTNWTGKVYDQTGKVFATCTLRGRRTICQ